MIINTEIILDEKKIQRRKNRINNKWRKYINDEKQKNIFNCI